VKHFRVEIDKHIRTRQKLRTSLELPLSDASSPRLSMKRRVNHDHIGSEHLLLGMLLEVKVAA
jgi:hypothetical protein